MKYSLMFSFLVTTLLYSNCDTVPTNQQVESAILAKDYKKATTLFDVFEKEMKEYLEKCNNTQEMFEQLNTMLLKSRDELHDLKESIKKGDDSIVHCDKTPSTDALDKAFESKDKKRIQSAYKSYQTDAKNYLDHCSSHAEYAEFYETSMLYEELYSEYQ
jgi:ssDNA-specific exonuclease RecJ